MYAAVPTVSPVRVRSFDSGVTSGRGGGGCDQAGCRPRIVEGNLRQAKIEHLHVIPEGDEQVGRLDVAMDDAAPVSGVERIRNLAGEVDHSLGRDRALLDDLLHRPPLEPLHRDERLPAMFPELVDHADVRVFERRGEAGFPFESREPFGGHDRVGAQQLDRDFAAEAEILGAIDHAHTALTELVEQTIVRNEAWGHDGPHPSPMAGKTESLGCAVNCNSTRESVGPRRGVRNLDRSAVETVRPPQLFALPVASAQVASAFRRKRHS